jgi:hypothetical protein
MTSANPACPFPLPRAPFLPPQVPSGLLLRPAGFVSLIVVLAPPRSSLVVDFFSDRNEIAVLGYVESSGRRTRTGFVNTVWHLTVGGDQCAVGKQPSNCLQSWDSAYGASQYGKSSSEFLISGVAPRWLSPHKTVFPIYVPHRECILSVINSITVSMQISRTLQVGDVSLSM